MKAKHISWTAWGVFGLLSAATIFSLILEIRSHAVENSILTPIGDLLWILLPLIFGFLAALIISHQPQNVIGWLLMVPTAVAVIGGPVETYLGSFGVQEPPDTLVNLLMAWFATWSWIVFIFPILFIL